jgi:hypothetical protein
MRLYFRTGSARQAGTAGPLALLSILASNIFVLLTGFDSEDPAGVPVDKTPLA